MTIAVDDILGIVVQLQSVGATHILVPRMPDLGLTRPITATRTRQPFSLPFNTALKANLPQGVAYYDTFGFIHKVFSNPGAYGFTDVTDPCLVGTTPCSNPNQYLFWDLVHPTTATDALLRRNSPTPFGNSLRCACWLRVLWDWQGFCIGRLQSKYEGQTLHRPSER